MTRFQKALDFSNYDLDAATKIPQFIDQGFDKFILGAQRIDPANIIGDAIIANGGKVLAVYAYLYFGYDVTVEVQKAIDVAKRLRVNFIALDVESTVAEENGPQTPLDRTLQLKQAVEIVVSNGFIPIIYTYRDYWIHSMGNSTDFSSYLLWYANYGMNDGNEAPIETVDFGGWNKVSIHQFCSGVEILGRNRDQNYILDETIFEKDDEMEAVKELNEAVMKRMSLIALASGDYEKMLKAYDLLKTAGLVP